LRHPFNWKKASMAAALCYGVRGGGAQLCFYVQAGSYDTDSLIEVLAELRKFLGGEKATLRWDGCRRTAAPPCASGSTASGPGWWSNGCPPKRPTSTRWRACGPASRPSSWANLTTPSLSEVIDQAHRGIERVRRTPHLAYSFHDFPTWAPRSAAMGGSELQLGLKLQVGGLGPGENPDSA
jgi:hypothetical protein